MWLVREHTHTHTYNDMHAINLHMQKDKRKKLKMIFSALQSIHKNIILQFLLSLAPRHASIVSLVPDSVFDVLFYDRNLRCSFNCSSIGWWKGEKEQQERNSMHWQLKYYIMKNKDFLYFGKELNIVFSRNKSQKSEVQKSSFD